jgi:hypothetical protein
MNLDHAIEAHRQWKVRLRMFINGTSAERLDPAAGAKDNQCDLGKWIHGPATAYASRPCYVALKGAHAEFHAGGRGDPKDERRDGRVSPARPSGSAL